MTIAVPRRWTLALLGLAFTTAAQAQSAATPTTADLSAQQWYLKDPQLDKVPGIGATRAYNELLKNKVPTPVIVAVIDSGIDTAHVDLKPVLWRNRGEIPGNKIDDDKNGYVDDVHGWNFLGGADGRNIGVETLEMTRLVAAGRVKFKGKTLKQVPAAQRAEFELYQKAETAYAKRVKDETGRDEQMQGMVEPLTMMVMMLKHELKTEKLDTLTLREAKFTDPNLGRVRDGLLAMMRETHLPDTDAVLKEVTSAADQGHSMVSKSLNLEYNPRPDIVKDNPDDLTQRYYGNNDLYATDPLHGTHVAGIIAAARDNNLGVQGVAGPMIRIMPVRAVPDGDERDKDVANAIRYAVDNGASIINMSFGKDFSPQRKAVDEAYRYAASKNVLLVHAAGNEDDNLDVDPHYPAPTLLDGKPVPNLLTVGASGPLDNESLTADFSNYSKKYVDVFAPGVAIFNTLPGSTYGNENGTSMAAPVTAGIAATLKSYFPGLTAVQLKDIIQKSAQVHHTQVRVPGTDKKADFATLSATGGVVNLYEAVKLAQTVAK
ncbi:S8 family peptidase [Hymenobacter sp. ASUV-10]|uniref:S8 family peptidase n=1 Tax=Hymenobacter aranciens TaxID=3063996 RepID=A0ABT9BDD7_9BACT|nr:S8 family peptidase [Hymenobacter sp. ASUV-10]MDO7876269.1 S8 family peptidase [Hymenobacter sp. ASUV-10]